MYNKPSYLCGPMSGYREWNFPAFDYVAGYLRDRGFRLINPADFGVDPKQTWADCLKRDVVTAMAQEQLICMPFHEESNGAKLETHVATALGIPVVSLRTVLESIPGTKVARVINHVNRLMQKGDPAEKVDLAKPGPAAVVDGEIATEPCGPEAPGGFEPFRDGCYELTEPSVVPVDVVNVVSEMPPLESYELADVFVQSTEEE